MHIEVDWLEAFHLITVTMWMVGLFYLPRLFVYHTAVVIGSDMDHTFRIMERRLFYYIMTPAMFAAVSLGLLLAFSTGHILSLWLHMKLIFVGILVLLHIFFWRCLIAFRIGGNTFSGRFFKVLNELVTFAFIVIVILAVVKPF